MATQTIYTLAKSATACPQKGQGTPPATALPTLSAAVSLEVEEEEEAASDDEGEGKRRRR